MSAGMTDLKVKRILGGIGNFYRYRLQILANLSGKHFGWNGTPVSRSGSRIGHFGGFGLLGRASV